MSLHTKKHDAIMLSLDQKSDNIFVADQTPTPTRLIKNCEEVGLFDDLRNVNPFEETFRRAVEQNNGHTPATTHTDHDEDSLHTPQVFPQLEVATEMLRKPLESPNSSTVAMDVSIVGDLLTEVPSYKMTTTTTSRQNSGSSVASSCLGFGKFQKYRFAAEKPAVAAQPLVAADSLVATGVQQPATLQLIQPQLITLSFPAGNELVGTAKQHHTAPSSQTTTAIPVQTVKPFILPKSKPQISTAAAAAAAAPPPPPATATATATAVVVTAPATPTAITTTVQSQPTHASLTPTSQLPIKERLKAILSHSSKSRIVELPQKAHIRRVRGSCSKQKFDEECVERRRAASTRYRVKIRNEHKQLRQRNGELQAENEKLRAHVRQLEQELAKQQAVALQQHAVIGPHHTVPMQLQIPPSTVRLIMNIPQLVVPPHGQPILQTPITYSLEKK